MLLYFLHAVDVVLRNFIIYVHQGFEVHLVGADDPDPCALFVVLEDPLGSHVLDPHLQVGKVQVKLSLRIDVVLVLKIVDFVHL